MLSPPPNSHGRPHFPLKGSGPRSAKVHGLGLSELKEYMVVSENVDIHDPAWLRDMGIIGPADPVKLVDTPPDLACTAAS
jgi:hypothetical protein